MAKTMKKLSVLLVIAILLSTFAFTAAATGFYYFNDFSGGISAVSAWGYNYQADDPTNSSNKIICTKPDSNVAATPGGWVYNVDDVTAETILFSVKVYPVASVYTSVVCGTPSVTGEAAKIVFDTTTGYITHEGSNLVPYSVNNWYTVQILMNTTNTTANIFINGGLVERDTAWGVYQTLSEIRVCHWNNGVVNRPCADDLLITSDPAYFPAIPAETFKISGSTPVNSATNVSINSSVTLNFDKAVNSTIANGISVTGGTTNPVILNVAVSGDGLSAVITFTSALEYYTAYTVAISSDTTDAAGHYISTAASSISFTTARNTLTYYYDFENGIGSTLAAWGTNSTIADPIDATNQVGYTICDTTADNGIVWSDTTLTGIITISMRVLRPTGSTAYMSTVLNNRTSTGKNNGSFGNDPATNVISILYVGLPSYVMAENKWYTFTSVINTDTGKANYYIDDVIVAGNKSGNFADVGSIRNIFKATTANDKMLYDDFLVTNDETYLPTAAVSILESSVADGATDIENSNNIISLTFNNALKASTVSSDTFVLTAVRGGTTIEVPAAVTLSSNGKTVTIATEGNLYYSTAYTLTLDSSVSSRYGTTLGQAKTISFTTVEGDRSISNLVFSSPTFTTGMLSASVDVLNEKLSAADATLIIALCKGTESSYNIENISCVTKNIPSGSTETITASINVTVTSGYFAKAFIWETFDSMQPLGTSVILK